MTIRANLRMATRQLAGPVLLVAGLGLLAVAQAAIPALALPVLGMAIRVGLWLGGAFLALRLMDFWIWDRLVQRMTGLPVPRLVQQCFGFLVYCAALAGILITVFGQSVTAIYATSGAIGVVLGLALRDIILDVFVGIAINIDRSIRLGDWVEMLDRNSLRVFGKVIEMHWRHTRILTDDHRVIIIPNSKLGAMVAANHSMPLNALVRFETPIILDNAIPSRQAIRVMLAGVRSARHVQPHPDPSVLISTVTTNGIEYLLRYFIDLNEVAINVAKSHVLESVLRHLDCAGIVPIDAVKNRWLRPSPPDDSGLGRAQRLLDRAELFAKTLEPDERLQLAQAMRLRLIPAGEKLLVEGAPGGSMFLVVEGLFSVSVDRQGLPVTLAEIAPGGIIGEMSLLTGEPRSADVTALGEAVVYEIAAQDLAPILAARPPLFDAISQLVAARSQTRDAAIEMQGIGATPQEKATQHLLQRMRNFFAGHS